jgi:predicted dienelactone hydrolase
MLRFVLPLLALLGLASPAVAVGFQQAQVADGAAPAIAVGIWYPSDSPTMARPLWPYTQVVAEGAPLRGNRLPVVLLSHGTGGSFAGHWDTGHALASAGFVVIGLTHTADNIQDHSAAGTFRGLGDRTRQAKRVLDWLLAEWPEHARLDPGRIGAFGFSAGGFTVLALAGGVPDLARGALHCATQPIDPSCRLAKPDPTEAESQASVVAEPRLRAVVAAAPALGWSFNGRALANLTVPVQLWRGAEDEVLRHPWHAEVVRRFLPVAPELHVVPRAGHYAFLAPCPDGMAAAVPEICWDAPGFDRAAFHRALNGAVVRFFQKTLR